MPLYSILKQKIIKTTWKFLPVDIEAKREVRREKKHTFKNLSSDDEYLCESIEWLCRAQDSGPDKGVARSYKTARYKGYGPFGWQESYPETTGYIIPTMLSAAKYLKDETLGIRAKEMADWEIDIQLPSGAVMGSVVTAKPSPAVFNTGQVIFGWLAAYRETNDSKYIKAAIKAGDYLLSIQEPYGSWHKGDSNFAKKGATTYNTRVAWALIELGKKTGKEEYITGSRKNVGHAISKQQDNGWFADNCLNDPDNPLLHTIVYATRGVLESGICLDDSEYIDAALKTLDALINCQRNDGGIPGRLNSHWQPAAAWDCLTGDAQVAVAWLRAHAITENIQYKDAARRAIDFIKKTQNLEHPNLGIRGGVKGSFPFDGKYGQFEMLNWAAKFFCDALMMINNEALAKNGIKG